MFIICSTIIRLYFCLLKCWRSSRKNDTFFREAWGTLTSLKGLSGEIMEIYRHPGVWIWEFFPPNLRTRFDKSDINPHKKSHSMWMVVSIYIFMLDSAHSGNSPTLKRFYFSKHIITLVVCSWKLFFYSLSHWTWRRNWEIRSFFMHVCIVCQNSLYYSLTLDYFQERAQKSKIKQIRTTRFAVNKKKKAADEKTKMERRRKIIANPVNYFSVLID